MKPIHPICTLLLLVLAAPSLQAQWQRALAPNGSFELDVNRDGQPDGWKPAVFRGQAAAAWDSAVVHTGKRSVRVQDSKDPADRSWNKNTGRWVQPARRAAKPGQPYTLRGWIKTDLTEGRATLTLAWFAGNKWLKETSTPAVSGKTDWTLRTLTIIPPDRADSVAVYLILNAGRGRAWFDDVMFTEGDRMPSHLRPLDIRAACTTSFQDEKAGDGQGGWTDQGANDLRTLPLGRQTWRNVPFDVADPASNRGKSCIVLKGKTNPHAPSAAAFPVG